MAFKKGQSGNPAGRKKGSISRKVALKNLLEEVFDENRDKAKELLHAMFTEGRDFRWLCDLKMQLELKELPNKLQGAGEDGEIKIKVEVANDGDYLQAPRFATPSIQ